MSNDSTASSPIKPVPVALKVNYSWGAPLQEGLGLITGIHPEWLDIYSKQIPEKQADVKVKMRLSNKAGSVELYGKSEPFSELPNKGFRILIRSFSMGERAFKDFLGVEIDRQVQRAESLEEVRHGAVPTAPRALANLSLLVGDNSPEHTATLMDISETGLYLKIGVKGTAQDWYLKQRLALELLIPDGPNNQSFHFVGRIVRIDPPGFTKYGEPGWGLAMQFRENARPSRNILEQVFPLLVDAPPGTYKSTWDGEEDSSSQIKVSQHSTAVKEKPTNPDLSRSQSFRQATTTTMELEEKKFDFPEWLPSVIIVLLVAALAYFAAMKIFAYQIESQYGPVPTPRAARVAKTQP